eukprot:TRINITY_DN74558_c0_g1_i1.p1 TRINITY_DN74558_c0_g1~~TRINITY_DN74558_c0_g1_i1.p1  ORF type:complete len:779 (-),score=189.85 TRINITY_DN74558_c0_g1_i1:6-2255(-)
MAARAMAPAAARLLSRECAPSCQREVALAAAGVARWRLRPRSRWRGKQCGFGARFVAAVCETSLAAELGTAPPAAATGWQAVLSPAQLDAAIADWWSALRASKALRSQLEDEHDVPAFFLRHDRVRDQFAESVRAGPLDGDLMALLLLPPAEALGEASAPGGIENARPLQRAVATFLAERYAAELAAFRRARRLADLRSPHDWFPSARARRRRWRIHLGPTNSGKTYGAAQHLLSAPTGLYMSPLRLLAWEMYERMQRAGLRCALRTGQETLGPDDATHVACTVEMAPLNARVDVGIIDEVQLVTSEVRGAAWTRALLGVQAKELHLCGSAEPAGLLSLLRQLALDCGDEVLVERHQRMAPLIVEERPLRGLQDIMPGDCLICFSRRDVLNMKAELEQLGRTPSVVYGSLPPEVRQEQAALFNDETSGRDVLVASDAIGMGLNLHIRRVVFQTIRKYDGESVRQLSAGEIRQIAGRAGRFGSRFGSRGLVNCLAAGDRAAVRAALEESTVRSAAADGRRASMRATPCGGEDAAAEAPVGGLRAALLPLPEQLEAFSTALEGELGRALPFADLLERFATVSAVSPRYFLGEVRDVVAVARSLAEVRLPPGEKFVFCQAPVSPRDVLALTALHDFARSFAASGRVAFPSVQLADPPEAATARHILELEELHRVCDVYHWLAGRFPEAFVNVAEARAARQLLSERLARLLRQPLAPGGDDEDAVGEDPDSVAAALADDAFVLPAGAGRLPLR